MSGDSEIVDWMEKNSHRLVVTRGKFGALKFMWGTRSDGGEYHWHDSEVTLREAVSAAIAFDRKQEEEKHAARVF
jgi:hypothetical protein